MTKNSSNDETTKKPKTRRSKKTSISNNTEITENAVNSSIDSNINNDPIDDTNDDPNNDTNNDTNNSNCGDNLKGSSAKSQTACSDTKSNNSIKIETEIPEVEQVNTCCLCGAPESDVHLILKGPGKHYICERCATMIHYQMDELYKYSKELSEETPDEDELDIDGADDEVEEITVPTPHQIKEYLDDYVIGQDDAKIKLSVAVYNHYKRIYQNTSDDIDIEKGNVLLLGETGCGKTALVKTIAKMLDVPMTIVDANSFTQAGYVGEDVESILSRLYQAADNDIEKAERGIVFIDEIDKIASKGDSPSITKDVSGEGVQQALLKILEGSKVRFTPDGARKHPEKPTIEIDTKNILFICSGAFVGIEKRISKRLNTNKVGFNNKVGKLDNNSVIEYLTAEDVRAFGMIPELVGRLPIITYVKHLDKDALKRILTEPKNSIIKQYKKLFDMDGVKLSFEDKALDYIVDKASEMKVGARGLRSIVEEIMTQYMYDIPSTDKKRLTVTKNYAEKIYKSKQSING